MTAQHYVEVNRLILTDFGTNIRLYKTLKISTKNGFVEVEIIAK